MTRLVALLIAAVALCGCRNSPPSMDPFLRTTVPPPGTTTGDQYYQGGAQPAATTPAATPAPVVPPPSKYGPPGGSFNYQQSSIDRPKAVAPGSAGLRMGNNWLTGGQPVKVPPPATSPTVRGAELSVAALNQPPETTTLPQATPLNVAQPKFTAAATNAAALQPAAGATPQSASGTTLRPELTLATAASPASAAAPVKADAQLASAAQSQPGSDVSTATFREPLGGGAGNSTSSGGDGGTVIRILEPRTADESSSAKSSSTSDSVAEAKSGAAEPASVSFNEITNLPLASPAHRAAVRSTWTRSDRTGGSAVAASAVAVTGGTLAKSAESKPTAAAVPPGGVEKYTYSPDYSSLRGKLEYSQSARQWKLRYIPIDGQTDRFGGSVVLPNSPLLEAYKAGDFVAVTGSLTSSATTRGFSPLYDLRQIEPAR